MAQDVVSDGLNQIMNAKKSGKETLTLRKHSKLLINLLDIAKQNGYLDYKIEGKEVIIEIKRFNEIKSIKPRYAVGSKEINKYVRRYLPAKNFGFVIISTNQGLMRHEQAEEKNIGGCLIAYMF
jgi:ribosomal protein S8